MSEIDRARFPALHAFLSGYLHQDFEIEYGGIENAIRVFVRDTSLDERQALLGEVRAVMALTTDWAWPDVQGAFSTLGSAWVPETREALEVFTRAVADAATSGNRMSG